MQIEYRKKAVKYINSCDLKRQPSFLRLQTGYILVYHMVTEKRVE